VQRKQMRHSERRISVTAAICVLSASSMAHAGPVLGTAAHTLTTNTPPARSARPLTLTLTAPRAPAMSMHRQPLALDAPRQGLIGRETASQLAPTDTKGAVAFPIRWQKRTEIERVARDIKHNGLPLVHLWGTGRSLLAIGLSPHGVPGIYFTQKVPD
jgi:hypothetical protein